MDAWNCERQPWHTRLDGTLKTILLDDLPRRFRPRWPRRDHLLWGVGGLIVGIVLTVVVLIWAAPQPPAVAKPPSSASDASFTINDAVLTNLTAAGIAQAGLPFSVTNIQAHIQPNEVIQITGDVPILGGLDIRRLSMTARLDVRDGHIVMHITQASVGGLGLPSILVAAIENSFDMKSAQLTNSLVVNNTHYIVSGISSTAGELTLRLRQQ